MIATCILVSIIYGISLFVNVEINNFFRWIVVLLIIMIYTVIVLLVYMLIFERDTAKNLLIRIRNLKKR